MTVIVTGTPRGGTTCVARIVDALGVPMIRDRENSMDWMAIRWAILEGRWDDVRRLVQTQPADQWGFKAPGIFGHLLNHFDVFSSPQIIYVVRDPVANAASILRHQVPPGEIVNPVMDLADELARAMHLIPAAGIPFLFISYEQILIRTVATVTSIATFLGVEFREDAIHEVVPGDPRYLQDESIVTAGNPL